MKELDVFSLYELIKILKYRIQILDNELFTLDKDDIIFAKKMKKRNDFVKYIDKINEEIDNKVFNLLNSDNK